MNKKIKKRRFIKVKKVKVGEIDYKDPNTFKKFIGENGVILPREVTGVSVKDQRRISNAIKNAREMALIPYI